MCDIDGWATKQIICEYLGLDDDQVSLDDAIGLEHAIFNGLRERNDVLQRKIEKLKEGRS